MNAHLFVRSRGAFIMRHFVRTAFQIARETWIGKHNTHAAGTGRSQSQTNRERTSHPPNLPVPAQTTAKRHNLRRCTHDSGIFSLTSCTARLPEPTRACTAIFIYSHGRVFVSSCARVTGVAGMQNCCSAVGVRFREVALVSRFSWPLPFERSRARVQR